MALAPRRSPWITIEVIGLVVLGVLAIVFPVFAGVAAAIFVGWLLVIVGVLGIVAAFAGRGQGHLGWSIASAVISVLAGILLLTHPLAAATIVTLLVAAYLIFDGVASIGYGLDQKKRGAVRWRWIVGAGVVDIVLAVLILALSGIGSAALIGVIIGISLIASGVGLYVTHRADVVAPAV